MDMSGSHRIEASRAAVWAALNDPDILRQCIPGCDEVVRQSDTEMTAKVVAKVGPVSAKFAGKVTLSDLDPPNGYTITGEGSGGAAGFGKGGATVSLVSEGEGAAEATILTYTAKAQVGGKLAQIGSRLVDATARKMAEEFFARFTRIVGAPATPVDAVPVEVVPADAAPVQPAAGPAAAPVAAESATVRPAATASAPPKPATRMAERPPEVPLPLPAGLVGGSFYVPWAALLVVAVLLAALAWMN